MNEQYRFAGEKNVYFNIEDLNLFICQIRGKKIVHMIVDMLVKTCNGFVIFIFLYFVKTIKEYWQRPHVSCTDLDDHPHETIPVCVKWFH